MESRHYWEENGHAVKYENYNSEEFSRTGAEQLSFAAPSEDEAEYPAGSYLKKGKVPRQDPMSHRIIEKRRRDRMNNCLADLSRLIPPEYLKKGRGRVEKTEIIEMAIRHLKYLQERANVAERQVSEDHFRAGFQEAAGEAVRFLVEVHGYGPGDGLCLQLATHMQRHCDHVTKGEMFRDKFRSHQGSSSETASSSSSSHGFAMKPSVITQNHRPDPSDQFTPLEPYEADRPSDSYSMDCDRGQMGLESEGASEEPLDGRRCRDDYLHSYKFKNSIERRFSRSQDCEATDMSVRGASKVLHKRRRAAKPPAASTSGSTDTSPQDTSSESPHNHHYEEPPSSAQYVPVFALNAHGKYYVPVSVEYACLARHPAARAALSRGPNPGAPAPSPPLHPVSLYVNFQPCVDCHVKRDPDSGWSGN